MRIGQMVVLALALGLLACGGGGGGTKEQPTPVPPPQIRLSMPGRILNPAESRVVQVISTEDPSTTVWTVNGGTILATSTGATYTAPTTPGRYEIKGSLKGNPAISATLAIHVVTVRVEIMARLLDGPGWGGYFRVDALPDGRCIIDSSTARGLMIWTPGALSCSWVSPCPVRPHSPETAVLRSGKFVQIGSDLWGQANAHSILEYDPWADAWSKVGETYYLRNGDQSSTVMQDGRLLLAGGQTGSGGENPTMEIWDPATRGVATFFSYMQKPRAGHSATLLQDGSVLIAGGWSGWATVLESEWVTSNLESRIGPRMKVDRGRHSASLLSDGRVFFAGGGVSPLLEVFNPATGAFEAAGSMDTLCFQELALSRLPSDKVVLMGGILSGVGMPVSDAVQVWVPELNECRTLGALPVPIYGAKATVGKDGIIYLFGGLDASSVARTEVIAIKVE